MIIADLDPVPGRECGACTVCCRVPAIDKPDIQKAPGIPCRHCGTGCAIYESRPAICRTFHCGWLQLPNLDESWRPDQSGVLVEIAHTDGETVLDLALVANPLKTLRQSWFIEFVTTGIAGGVPLSLSIPGPPGCRGASLRLDTAAMMAAANSSRAKVKECLERDLKRLQAHKFEPRMMTHRGCDFGTPPAA